VAAGVVLEPVAPSAAPPTQSVAEAARRDAKGRPTGRAASPIDVTSMLDPRKVTRMSPECHSQSQTENSESLESVKPYWLTK
jgi:hypothetical protein